MNLPLEQVPPCNKEAERSVLGAMLCEPGVIPQVKNAVTSKRFYVDAHRVIFEALVELYKKKEAGGLLRAIEALRGQAKLEQVGGESYLAGLLDSVHGTAAYAVDHAQLVKEKALDRELMAAGNRAITEASGDGGTPADKQAFLDEFASQMKELQLEHARTTIKPTKSLRDYLDEKYERECAREKGLLGYDLRTLNCIAQKLDGIQPGFYIVGAETNVGKTAFLCTIFLDLLETNEETTGIYFSLDDRKDAIINRFLVNLSDVPLRLNEIQKKQEGSTETERKKAYERLKDFYDIGRLDIRDATEIDSVGALEAEIASRAHDNLFVVIDGLYNLDVGVGRSFTIREMNIERANRIKALADVHDIPVLASAELRKKGAERAPNRTPVIDDLMESSKFAYNANLVWLLSPDNPDAFDTHVNHGEVDVVLRYAKNKLSSFRGGHKLAFMRDYGRMEEARSEL